MKSIRHSLRTFDSANFLQSCSIPHYEVATLFFDIEEIG
jgi:hypothetical protein